MAAEVVQLLEASINPQQHREAETALREREKSPGFSVLLLQITASSSYPETVRLSSALCFKNLIRRSWTDEDGHHLLPAEEVSTIKTELVGLMISSPARIQAQLGDAISVIADSDFGDRWPTLIDDLVSRLSPDNTKVNTGVLQVAHSIFKRWRPLYRSDELFSEINDVLTKFATPFLTLLQHTDGAIQKSGSEKAALRDHFATLEVSFELLYDLSIQDLPPMFEDNLESLGSFLQKYLQYDNPILHTDDENEAGPIENVKASIFEVVTMWTQKYDDAFNKYISQFVDTTWHLLTTLGPDTKYDLLTSRALQFLTSIAGSFERSSVFDNEQTLSQIVEKVILPNVTLREVDIELFEDEPIEFTRTDLEGSDSETRRRAATDFLRQLMRQFQQRVTDIVMRYVNHYLQEYSKDRSEKWRSKDTAMYLYNAIAAVGQATTGQGVVTVNPHLNIMEFFQNNVANDLVSDSGHVLLQVDAIKYLYLFRSQLTRDQWQEVFPMLVRQLGSENYVLHTYSAVVIDRALHLTSDTDKQPYIPKSTLAKASKEILQRLFSLIEKDSAPEKVQENEFLMRCVMRVLVSLQQELNAHFDFILTHFVNIIRVIRHNPSNPRFYYYLFESVGAFIRFSGPEHQEKLETTLYAPFSEILSGDVQEFIPYVFQLFAALLESNPSAQLSEYYQSLIPAVVHPQLWESRGNSPALARLLASLIARGPQGIVNNNYLEQILGIFQRLINSKINDVHGFDLLETLVIALPHSVMAPYYNPIFNLILTRLSNNTKKDDTFALRFIRLYHLMSARLEQGLGTDAFKAAVDSIKPNLFKELYPSVILAQTQKLSRPTDRRIAVVSFTKTLGDSEAFATEFAKGWSRTCEGLLGLMVNPPTVTRGGDDMLIEANDPDDIGFGVGFTQLNTCRKQIVDPYPNTGDLKAWIGNYLQSADQRHGGRVQQFIQERLTPETRTALMGYLQG